MNEIKKTEAVAKNITNPESKFTGYTLEEIRYQRALVAIQAEFCKTKILRSINNFKDKNPFSASAALSLKGKTGTIVTKLISGLNYIDYVIIGFSVFKSIKKITTIFKKGKK